MTFPNIETELAKIKEEDSDCDFTEEMIQTFKVAKLKCKFEIQKIDETNATIVFGITSGVNTETGEALDMDPDPPVSSTATYIDGVFKSNIKMDEDLSIDLNFDMKKNNDNSITFENNTSMQGVDDDGSIISLGINLTGLKQ